MKKTNSKTSKNSKLIKTPPVQNSLKGIFTRDIKILKVKDVKRAMSRLIIEFCKGTVKNDEAKTLTYLLSTYIQIIQQAEFEIRLTELERKTK